MSNNSIKAKGARSGQANFPASNNPALLLDKLHVRRSTPDSEALASSDEEADAHRLPPVVMHKPARRASWLNDTSQPSAQPRKNSFAGSSMSPTTSHPTTPSVETAVWAAHGPPSAGAAPVGRGHSASTSFPWGTAIWTGGELRKEPPSRLTEVLASPTTMISPSSNMSSNSSTFRRDSHQDGAIPFAVLQQIPIHPTPKTYRSQSYSVGQLEPDSSSGAGAPSGIPGRSRLNPHSSALQHRPSRPSMLSEVSNDGMALGNVKEVEDDENYDSADSLQKGRFHVDQARRLEELARENAILRQQNAVNSRLRTQSNAGQMGNSFFSIGIHDSFPEESEYAIDELEEQNELQDIDNRIMARRLSEYNVGSLNLSSHTSAENRKLESVKKAYWQSSLGFGGLADIPQSRRHSFADIPTRHGSVSSIPDPARDTRENHSSQDLQNPYNDVSKLSLHDHAMSYFGGGSGLPRGPEAFCSPTYVPSAYNGYGSAPQYGNNRAASPHRNMYGLPQPRQNQLLYIVLFKCSRADVFYVQEGTGLSVKPGDLVIVEADRGTDLGTVAVDNVDWAHAKDLKEHYSEEHYKWLMMYSQGAVGTADGTGAGLMASSNGLQGSAVGGMGPPTQHGMQEPSSTELKPKIIKRLAQPHEIQNLRDKEGNEAKAKRVCMQKVKEHGLHMEILDAEFQMDWKKLTFYYFADAYINFNSLVTDLFKVYKTRIWMSAINPASFASPSLGLQAPSGIGPGAVGMLRSAQPDRRTQPDMAVYSQASRGYATNPGGAYPSNTTGLQHHSTQFQAANYATYGYSPFATAQRSTPFSADYQSNVIQTMDPFPSFPNQNDYHNMPHRLPSARMASDNGYPRQNGAQPGSDAWVNSMQGLSLNSR